MKRFHCFDADSPGDEVEIEADSADSAAGEFAERKDEQAGYYPSERSVRVREAGADKWQTWSIRNPFGEDD